MKLTKLILTASVATIAFSSIAFADEYLPTIENVKVEIDPGPQLAAVQPTGFVKFKYESCAKMEFEAEVEQREYMYVTINNLSKRDCKGPTVNRTYDVQISSDMPLGARVVILNPIRAEIVK